MNEKEVKIYVLRKLKTDKDKFSLILRVTETKKGIVESKSLHIERVGEGQSINDRTFDRPIKYNAAKAIFNAELEKDRREYFELYSKGQ